MTFRCATLADTQKLAEHIGAAVKGGDVFEFHSDLGGGKTAFVKGLAKGMGVKGVVQSPSFTISFVHKAARDLELHHFDFYRLQEAGIMRAELAEALVQPNAVVAIEWGDIVHDILPSDRITVTLQILDNDERSIAVEASQSPHIIKAMEGFNHDSHA